MVLLGSDRVGSRLSSLEKSDRFCYLLFFVLGFVLRGIPELLVAVYPVGYETITYYAPAMMAFPGKGLVDVFVEWFRAGPLFYVLMWLAANVTGAHAFVILKVVGPLLYGSLIVSFFVFLKKGLKFEWKLAFVASLLLVFQVAALRDSWDRFRTVLGLVFFFAGLAALKSDGKHKLGLLAVFGLLTVLSRDYVAVLLFVSVLGFLVLEKKGVREWVRPLVALVPAFVVFGVMVFPWLSVYWGGVVGADFASGSYLWVVQDAFVIFAVCYLAVLPFVVLGLRGRRDWLVASMLVWLLIASFSVVGGPLFSVPGYQRWLMLLVFPLCVYAVWGFERLRLFTRRRLWMLVAVVLVFVVVGSGYSTGLLSYVGIVPNSYVAVNLVGSSVPLDRVENVKAVLAWLDVYAVSGSAVLTEECLYGWSLLYLTRANKDVRIIWFGSGSLSRSVLETALDGGGVGVVYLFSFGLNVGGFSVVYSWNGVSVSEYSTVAVE